MAACVSTAETKNVGFRWTGVNRANHLNARCVIVVISGNPEYNVGLPDVIDCGQSLTIPFKQLSAKEHNALRLTVEQIQTLSFQVMCLNYSDPKIIKAEYRPIELDSSTVNLEKDQDFEIQMEMDNAGLFIVRLTKCEVAKEQAFSSE